MYISEIYPEISIKTLTIFLPFSTLYLYQQGLLALAKIKNKKRKTKFRGVRNVGMSVNNLSKN